MAERLVVNPAAPVIAAKAAVMGASTGVSDAIPSLPGEAMNAFDAALAMFHTWADRVHQGVASSTAVRGETVGNVCAAGFGVLHEMNIDNAADFGRFGQTR